MRFSAILITYFVVAATMWGGGVITWDQTGVGGAFIEDPSAASGSEALNPNTTTALNRLGGPITQVAGESFGGGLIATWNVLVSFTAFLFWPTAVLVSVNAPPQAVVLGTTLSVAFLAAMLRIVRGSA